jgi:hypothetical protein
MQKAKEIDTITSKFCAIFSIPALLTKVIIKQGMDEPCLYISTLLSRGAPDVNYSGLVILDAKTMTEIGRAEFRLVDILSIFINCEIVNRFQNCA